MQLLHLPDCMLEEIFGYLSYDEVAKKRLVSVQINKICQNLLNRGFSKMIKRHSLNLKKIKSLLPRRESERRHHPLSKHADILTCIETRISMLSMTYTKYIDLNLCCFIPGKVIDEVFNVLKLVDSNVDTTKPLRAHEVLQELRDISSMAIDHFDEKIAHILKKSYCDFSSQKFGSTIYQIMQSPIDTALVMQPDFGDLNDSKVQTNRDELARRQEAQANNLALQKMEQKYKDAISKINQVIYVQHKQNRKLRNSSMQISELNSQIVDLRRRLEESDSKNRELTAKINQITISPNANSNTSSSGGGGVSGDGTVGNSPETARTIRRTRNIKPRAATIILKRRIDEACKSETPAKQLKIDQQ